MWSQPLKSAAYDSGKTINVTRGYRIGNASDHVFFHSVIPVYLTPQGNFTLRPLLL